jgi:hypothetical protein
MDIYTIVMDCYPQFDLEISFITDLLAAQCIFAFGGYAIIPDMFFSIGVVTSSRVEQNMLRVLHCALPPAPGQQVKLSKDWRRRHVDDGYQSGALE